MTKTLYRDDPPKRALAAVEKARKLNDAMVKAATETKTARDAAIAVAVLDHGMSMTDVAARIGVSQPTVGRAVGDAKREREIASRPAHLAPRRR